MMRCQIHSVAQVKLIGSALARHMGGDGAEVIRHLVQRVSILLTKVLAACLLCAFCVLACV